MAGTADPFAKWRKPKRPAQTLVPLKQNEVKLHAARLFGRGMDIHQVARIMVDYLVTEEMRSRPMDQKLPRARAKLRRWLLSRDSTFRDAVYEQAVVELDLSTPGILVGISRRAKRGNIQAARLALELTGRHNPKGEVQPTTVNISFGSVPRPVVKPPADVEAEVEDEEDVA